jgi:hypothetical protein
MKQIRVEGERLSLEIREVGDMIRPPIASIPAYRARRAELRS